MGSNERNGSRTGPRASIIAGFCLVALGVGLLLPARVVPAAEKTVDLGKIRVRITEETEKVSSDVEGSIVKCGGFATDVSVEFQDGFSMDMTETTRKEMSKAVEIGLGATAGPARLSAQVEFRDRLVNEMTGSASRKLVTRCTKTIRVEPMDCYNIKVVREYTKHKYSGVPQWVEGKRPFFASQLERFSWDEYAEPDYIMEATYDETCDPSCRIGKKSAPVVGRDKQPLWASIKYKNQKIFLLPLFFDDTNKLVDVLKLLPPNIRRELSPP